ncbi:hypothetical protein GOP47_0017141 [Adiantum capillus-veneris]|uniref:Uncharacterized protein n=1 Tax=Adiantum capillus-veneris TaxID=13818 RepID=A0A9D4UJ13_ADICA|nr:hypothetical protein GOP47_0017141 [Adiantum capillus-veneris]
MSVCHIHSLYYNLELFKLQVKNLEAPIYRLEIWQKKFSKLIASALVITFLSRLGKHANLIIGGGQHMNAATSGNPIGKCSLKMLSVINPTLYFQFSGAFFTILHIDQQFRAPHLLI